MIAARFVIPNDFQADWSVVAVESIGSKRGRGGVIGLPFCDRIIQCHANGPQRPIGIGTVDETAFG